jgi:ADP-heptose:LPS heptosyltransferase
VTGAAVGFATANARKERHLKVLALQRRRVGDILMTTPALRALRARFPQARVTYVCEPLFSPILRGNGDVETLMAFDPGSTLRRHVRLGAALRARRFDLALDFEGSAWSGALAAASGATRRIGLRSSALPPAYTDRVASREASSGYAAVEKLLLLEPLGIDVRAVNPRPVLSTTERARDWARRTLETGGIGSGELLLTLAPGSRAPHLSWPLASFARLLDLLAASHDVAVVLFPWSGDKSLGAEIARLTSVPLFQLDTTPSLRQMAALLDRADLHLGNESAATHMASALGTATLTLYAPGLRRRWSLTGDPLQVGLEPATSPGTGSGSSAREGDLPIARITPEAANAALLALEAYLPRLRAARRTPSSTIAGQLPAARLQPVETRRAGGRAPIAGEARRELRPGVAGEGAPGLPLGGG